MVNNLPCAGVRLREIQWNFHHVLSEEGWRLGSDRAEQERRQLGSQQPPDATHAAAQSADFSQSQLCSSGQQSAGSSHTTLSCSAWSVQLINFVFVQKVVAVFFVILSKLFLKPFFPSKLKRECSKFLFKSFNFLNIF